MPKAEQRFLKPSLKGVVVALAGEFVVAGKSYKESQVAGWVRLRQGEFTDKADASVTHLLCSKEDFDDKTPTVKHILKLNKDKRSSKSEVSGKPCFILTPDWLEETCMATKRLKEEDYRLDKKSTKDKLQRKGANQPHGFHVYMDETTHFEHKVTITRTVDNDTQRYELMILETNVDKPHLYLFQAKYLRKKGDRRPAYHQPSQVSGTFRHAWNEFTHFFKNKTGVGWDKRLDNAWLPGKFRYEPPTGGKPAGVLPVCLAEGHDGSKSAARGPHVQAQVAVPADHGAHETDAGIGGASLVSVESALPKKMEGAPASNA